MNKPDQFDAVASSLQQVMSQLDEFYTDLVGRGEHNIVLLVGAGDQVQCTMNVPRAQVIEMVTNLLAQLTAQQAADVRRLS